MLARFIDPAGGLTREALAVAASFVLSSVSVIPMFLLPRVPAHIHEPLMHALLAISCGSLVANAFLHILPEALEMEAELGRHGSMACPLSTLAGIMALFVLEKLSMLIEGTDQEGKETERKKIAGYLNILVNMLDNAAHGLTLSAAFAISADLGWVTTAATLLHEIPHEFGDYAILMSSGLSLREAVYGQLFAALGGVAGALGGATLAGTAATPSLLCFTAGGFIYIAMVSLAPAIKATSSFTSMLLDLVYLGIGVLLVAVVSFG
eukprot:m.90642 g.90642  ORF g.90642 m.90642 type:complete len:265 (+) comp8473_c0_seq3:36-830(+)